MLTALKDPAVRGPVAIVGGGLMGHALAASFLAAGYSTSVYEAVPAWTMRFLAACGKTPVHVRQDTPGFIGEFPRGR